MRQAKIIGSVLIALGWITSLGVAFLYKSNVAAILFITPLVIILIALLYMLFDDIYR